MELKRNKGQKRYDLVSRFNRTFMELKPKNAAFGTKDADVLIGPSWN